MPTESPSQTAYKTVNARLMATEERLRLLQVPQPDTGTMLKQQQVYGEVLGLYFALGVLDQVCRQEEGQ